MNFFLHCVCPPRDKDTDAWQQQMGPFQTAYQHFSRVIFLLASARLHQNSINHPLVIFWAYFVHFWSIFLVFFAVLYVLYFLKHLHFFSLVDYPQFSINLPALWKSLKPIKMHCEWAKVSHLMKSKSCFGKGFSLLCIEVKLPFNR